VTMFYRAPGAHVDHLYNAAEMRTACGLDGRWGTRFRVSAAVDERPADVELPLCEECRAASFLVGR